MCSLSPRVWIANAAAVLSGSWGDVSRRSQQAGCSRQTVYQHAEKVQQAVERRVHGDPEKEQLHAEIKRLEKEIKRLRQEQDQAIFFEQAKQQQFAATACAMGMSLSQVVVLLALVLPAGRQPSRSTVGRWIDASCQRAGKLLAVLDRACRSLVLVLALDEIFFRRQPVLVGVEPASMAWVLGQRAENRSGATWQAALAPWERLEFAVADGGTGLQKGLAATAAAREDVPQSSPLEVGLDVFHTAKEASPIVRRLWQKVEKLWEQYEQAEETLAQAKQQGHDARAAAAQVRSAWHKVEKAFSYAEQMEAAWKRAEQALAVFLPEGRLNDRSHAQAEIAAALEELSGSDWAKVRRMLTDARALTFLDRLHRQLQQAVADPDLREALTRLWWLRRQRVTATRQGQAALWAGKYATQLVICQRLSSQWRQAYRRVAELLRNVVRASSVVECMNSVIRMHQARHRTLSQALMDLKRLYWNCRSFREGKRRERCPYEHLGLLLPSYDWWELLQREPEELEACLNSPSAKSA